MSTEYTRTQRHRPTRGQSAGAPSSTGHPTLFHQQVRSGADPAHANRVTYGIDDGRKRRDEGRTVAYAASAAPWTVRADAWLLGLEPGTRLSADDLAREVGHPTGGSAQAVGGWFARCSKKGWIEAVAYEQSQRPSRNASRQLVYLRTEVGP